MEIGLYAFLFIAFSLLSRSRYMTQDQFASKTLNCDFHNGLCPDTRFGGARDDVEYMGSVKNHGLSVIDFKKSIMPTDMYDAPVAMDGPTQVLVGIGSLAPPPGSYGSLDIETHLATQKARQKMSQNNIGIGYSRSLSALAVSRRSGVRSGTFRADA